MGEKQRDKGKERREEKRRGMEGETRRRRERIGGREGGLRRRGGVGSE